MMWWPGAALSLVYFGAKKGADAWLRFEQELERRLRLHIGF